MKKLLFIVSLFIFVLSVKAQYPITQNLGNDSTKIDGKGAIQSRFINKVFTDTTQANTQRIRQYPGAQIYTTSDSSFWVRNPAANAWRGVGGQRFGLEDNLFTSNRAVSMGGFNMATTNGNWGFNSSNPTRRITIGDDTGGDNSMFIYAPNGSAAFIETKSGSDLGINSGGNMFFKPNSFTANGQIQLTTAPTVGYLSQYFYTGGSSIIGDIGINLLDAPNSIDEFYLRPHNAPTRTTEVVVYGNMRFPEVTRINDTTNFDIGGIDRTTGQFRRIPSDLIGGSGGGGGDGGIHGVYAGYGLTKNNDSTLSFSGTLRDSIIDLTSSIGIEGKVYEDSGWTAPEFSSHFTQTGGVTVTDSSGILVFSGGASNFNQYLSINLNQPHNITPFYHNLERWIFKVRMKVITTGTIGVGVKSTATNINNVNAIATLNTATGQSSFIGLSASNLTITPGDLIDIVAERNQQIITVTVRNATTNSASITTTSQWTVPTGNVPVNTGQFAIFSHSGKFYVNSISISTNENHHSDVLMIGTSKTAGWNAGFLPRLSSLLQKQYSTVNWAGQGEVTADWLTTYPMVIALNPKSIILEAPRNDYFYGVNTDSIKARYYRLERFFRDSGINVYHNDGFYETNTDISAWRTYLYSTRSTDSILYIYNATNVSGSLDADGIHPTVLGNLVAYKEVVQEGKLPNGVNAAVNTGTFIANQFSEFQPAAFSIINTSRSRVYGSLNVGTGSQVTSIQDIPLRVLTGAGGVRTGGFYLWGQSNSNNFASVDSTNATWYDMNLRTAAFNLITNNTNTAIAITSAGVATVLAGFKVNGSTTQSTTSANGDILAGGYLASCGTCNLNIFPGDGTGTNGLTIRGNANTSAGWKQTISWANSTGVASPTLSLIGSGGFVGVNKSSPTALLHLGAGTATASTAPLKFTTGTSLTSAEAGAVEYTTDDLFFTISTGTARKRFLFADPSGGLTSARVPIITTNGRLTDDAGFTYASSRLSPTYITLAAGTATAGTAPIKQTSGTLLSTIEAGAKEYNNAHYESNSALNRYAIGGAISDMYTTVGNVSTTETDLYTYTTKANTFNANGEKLYMECSGVATQVTTTTRVLRVYFAGTVLATYQLASTGLGGADWSVQVTGIRASSSEVRWKVVFTATVDGASDTYTDYGTLGGLTLSGTNILKVTGEVTGAGAGNDQLSALMGVIRWEGAASN